MKDTQNQKEDLNQKMNGDNGNKIKNNIIKKYINKQNNYKQKVVYCLIY